MLSLSYNCHVHRSTGETPFFLTLLVFDVAKPRQFYAHGFVEDSYVIMQSAFASAKMSMEQAATKSKGYHDRAANERSFHPRDLVLCYFPNVPPGVNQKFYTKWRPFVVLRQVGRVNVLCQEEHGKPNRY